MLHAFNGGYSFIVAGYSKAYKNENEVTYTSSLNYV